MKVIISQEAIKENQNNIDYIIEKWGIEVLKNYLEKFDKIIEYLENDILQARFDSELGLYKVLIVEQIYLFYEVKDSNTIIIITTWNNYKNPYWL